MLAQVVPIVFKLVQPSVVPLVVGVGLGAAWTALGGQAGGSMSAFSRDVQNSSLRRAS